MSAKSFFFTEFSPSPPTQTFRLSLGPVFRAKLVERLAKIETLFSQNTMPVDNRRIVGPEETQPVVFVGEKCSKKTLVTTGMYICFQRFEWFVI